MKAEILDDTTNAVVVQVPGRNYPGLVLQGDQLAHLRIMAESDDPFQKNELVQELSRLEEHYLEVCQNA